MVKQVLIEQRRMLNKIKLFNQLIMTILQPADWIIERLYNKIQNRNTIYTKKETF